LSVVAGTFKDGYRVRFSHGIGKRESNKEGERKARQCKIISGFRKKANVLILKI
jgi:hypothetical protein